MNRTLPLLIAGLAAATVLAGCNNPKSSYGLRLPDGNIERGRQAFFSLKCYTCHRVEGVEQLTPPTRFNLTLGGETTRVKTYGELVTAIINPTHFVANKYTGNVTKESPMPQINEEMTVAQMIDLVAFLQAHYKLVPNDRLLPNY